MAARRATGATAAVRPKSADRPVEGTIHAAFKKAWYRAQHPFSGLGSCLLYHRVAAGDDQEPFHPTLSLSVHPAKFQEQMEYISEAHQCLDLPTAVSLLKSKRLPLGTVVVTFDDGYRDNLINALPVLERHNVPATIFVTTGFIDGRVRPWWFEVEHIVRVAASVEFDWGDRLYSYPTGSSDEKHRALLRLFTMMRRLNLEQQEMLLAKLYAAAGAPALPCVQFLSWEEVVELDRHPLITIGAHTRNHLMLRALSMQCAEREIADAKRILEERLGHPVQHFAYPFGGADAAGFREMRLVRNAGFQSACVTDFGHLCSNCGTTCFALPRVTIDYQDTLSSVKRKLRGIDAFIFKYLKGSFIPIIPVPAARRRRLHSAIRLAIGAFRSNTRPRTVDDFRPIAEARSSR